MSFKYVFFAILFSLAFLSHCSAPLPKYANRGIGYDLTPQEEAFLDTLQRRSFLYFWHESNPKNGLVKDRSTRDSPASIAAVGFALPVWAVGVERGWITRQQAVERTLACLRFFVNSKQSPDSLVTGYRGFYYHFLDMQTGLRTWDCELSTIDTALLLAGVRFAAQYYDGRSALEQEIRALAEHMTLRVDWDWITFPDTARLPNGISMGWKPEQGFNHHVWLGYNEALILFILAAGSTHSNPENAYKTWLSHYEWREPHPELAHVVFPPLFGHQYSHIFVDFRGLVDEYMQEKGIDYFENSRRATLTQRQYAIDNPLGWAGYDSLTWGLTACDGPGPSYNTNGKRFFKYHERGASGPDLIQNDDGTIAPTAAAGCIAFAPEVVVPSLMSMRERYGNKGLWGPYGFYDAFNPTLNWFNPDYIGIDQGPIVLMIENFRTGLVWEVCMRDPVIQKGLQRLGFRPLQKD